MGQDRGHGGEEVVGDPSWDSVPEAVHVFAGAGVAGEQVGPLGEYGEEKLLGDGVAEKRSDASAGGGKAFHQGESSLA